MDSYRHHSPDSESRQEEEGEKLLSGSSSENGLSDRVLLRRGQRGQSCWRRIIALGGFFAFLAIYSFALVYLVRDSVCLAESRLASGQLIYSERETEHNHVSKGAC